jgi:signal transduction histidine kinase
MKPLKSETNETAALSEIGRASVQIVHDLKNQLNGLKLYATFLRKRMERDARPADEQETLAKLIAGLERAASDMTLLVRYSRPVELRLQPQTDLVKILSKLEDADHIRLEADAARLSGAFDVAALTESLKIINSFAQGGRAPNDKEQTPIHLLDDANDHQAIIEWRGLNGLNGDDPFHSFAGSEGLRLSLAAKIIEAHGGATSYEEGVLRVRLPLAAQEESAASFQQPAQG